MSLAAPGATADRAFTHTANVVEQIGIAIVAGEYPEQTMIPLDPDLEEMFGVSRTVVREAKKTLIGKGLLESKAKVGTRVRASTDWNMFDPDVLRWHSRLRNPRRFLDELFEVRLIFEPPAAARVARHAGPAAQEILTRHCDALAGANSRMAFAMADLEFHKAILHLSGNRFLQSLGDLVQVALIALLETETRGGAPKGPEDLARVAAEHREIVAAIAARAPTRASEAMSRVIVSGRQDLILPG
ncbi:FadR/GntR family transcriptional regulator [Tropicimonas sp. IMCC34043]|uniref:FadR/GntR family transcriptional regulator n=1 Tax=Tropicimonas sp. IMCC34043 TaxID=2248760 RepID=UPI000E2570DF|nr:FadR/GntR family transcriptional regulator [Tropicimonas sp. IMCC34043]